jgi:hypothetical protein
VSRAPRTQVLTDATHASGVRDSTGCRLAPTSRPSRHDSRRSAPRAGSSAVFRSTDGWPHPRLRHLRRLVGEIGSGGLVASRPPRGRVVRGSRIRQQSGVVRVRACCDPHAPYRPPPRVARFPSEGPLRRVSWTDLPSVRCLTRSPRSHVRRLVITAADHGEGLGVHGEGDALVVRLRSICIR